MRAIAGPDWPRLRLRNTVARLYKIPDSHESSSHRGGEAATFGVFVVEETCLIL
jgi:hypothetical protein